MQMRAGGASRGADRTEGLAATDVLTLADIEGGEMSVERVDLCAVVDDHESTISGIAAGEDHLAIAARRHGHAVASLDVESRVQLAATPVGRRAHAEAR